MLTANIFVMVFAIPMIAVLAGAYAWLWGWPSLYSGWGGTQLWIMLLALLLGVVLHERIHGVTWAMLSGKPLSVIRFGVQLRTLTPYAHATEPLPIRAYVIGAMAPGLVLGILPCLIAMIFESSALMLGGLFLTAVAGGDILILWCRELFNLSCFCSS